MNNYAVLLVSLLYGTESIVPKRTLEICIKIPIDRLPNDFFDVPMNYTKDILMYIPDHISNFSEITKISFLYEFIDAG